MFMYVTMTITQTVDLYVCVYCIASLFNVRAYIFTYDHHNSFTRVVHT